MEISRDEIQTYESNCSLLGRGTYGRVHLCSYKNRMCAIKITQLFGDAKEMTDTVEDVKQEAAITKKMEKSCYIIGVLGIVKWDGWMGIVMEYAARNNLHYFIKSDKKNEIILATKLRIIYQIAAGLNHLHNFSFYTSITHNDLSSNNILLDENLQVKISDFGGSSLLARSGCQPHGLNEISEVRTVRYTAPEYSVQEPRTKEMDVISFAMTIYFVLSHEDPFETIPSADIADKYKGGGRPKDPSKRHIFTRQDDEIFDILIGTMKKCWTSKPKSRPPINDMKDVLKPHNDRFIEEVNDFVEDYIKKTVVRKWENQPKISLENLCASLNVA